MPPVVDLVAVFVLNFLYVFVGVRTFRGPGEDVAAPRAWWRATARPLAGFIIGGIASVLALISLLGALGSSPEQSGTAAVVCVGWALLAAYYLNSSFRLRALDQPGRRPRPPRPCRTCSMQAHAYIRVRSDGARARAGLTPTRRNPAIREEAPQ